MSRHNDNPIQPRNLKILLALSGLVALPHALNMPPAITLFFLAVMLWRLGLFYYPRLKPHRLLLFLLTFCGLGLVYSQHLTLIGRGAGVSLLTTMLALKLMELNRQRDVYVVVFISFFVIVTQFLYSQNLALTLYLLTLVVCLLALLLEVNQATHSRNLFDPLKRTLVITAQGLPVALILFILFPRLSHPIWQMGSDGVSGITGLSDRVSPGSISQLTQSRDVAFRVSYKSEVPPPEERYWRGLVLWDTDGYAWYNRKTNDNQKIAQQDFLAQRRPVEYEVSLEPHYRNWLFALDLPATTPSGSTMTGDYLLRSMHPVKRLMTYNLISFTRYQTGGIGDDELRRALALPDNLTQRERNLVAGWRAEAATSDAIIVKALQHYNQEDFVYTLQPPLYSENPADQFLFEEREGFCEHFAGSFILLMRLAGIPARMVLGYQGGEFNPVGDYYILRQSDAHAWAEVWLAGRGWTRIDPTAAVAPERVRHSILNDVGLVGQPVLFRIDDDGLLANSIRHLQLALDAANIGWRRWILDYNHSRQFELLKYIGLDHSSMEQWLGLMFSLIAIALVIIGLRIGLQGRRKTDPVIIIYRKLCNILAAAGMPRRPSEGPLDYSRRLLELLPEREQEISKIFGSYMMLRYGRNPDPQLRQDLKQMVSRFRP